MYKDFDYDAKIVLFLEITNYFIKRLKIFSLPHITAREGRLYIITFGYLSDAFTKIRKFHEKRPTEVSLNSVS